MGRAYFIAGQSLVKADGSELALTESPIALSFNFIHDEVQVNAWGGRIPPALQFMLSSVDISLSCIHFDYAVFETCMAKSMGAAAGAGTMPTAGAIMKQASDFIQLTITSPVGGVPWKFYTTYVTGLPISWPIGAEKSVVQCSFRALPIPADGDPWRGGVGSKGTIIWDHTN